MSMPSGTTEMRVAGMPRYVRMNSCVLADGDKPIHGIDVGANERQRLLAIGRCEAVEKQFLALERDEDRLPERAFQGAGHRDHERVGKIHDVRWRLVARPFDQLVELLAQRAMLPFQHRHGEIAEQARITGHGTPGKRVDDTWGIPQTVEKPGRLPEQRGILLKIDADTAEEHAAAADVRLVRPRRRIDRHQCHVVMPRHQLARQRVVAETAHQCIPAAPAVMDKMRIVYW